RIRGGVVNTFTSADGLPDDFIRSLLVDADGSLWIATRRGLTHWIRTLSGESSGMRMETFTQAEGLGSDLVGAMARDTNGDLWVATFAGLSRLQKGKITNYTTANGLISRETAINSHPSAWQAQDGRLWFATPKGLESVDPAHFPVNLAPPPVAIERFAVDDRDQPLRGADFWTRVAAGHGHFQ